MTLRANRPGSNNSWTIDGVPATDAVCAFVALSLQLLQAVDDSARCVHCARPGRDVSELFCSVRCRLRHSIAEEGGFAALRTSRSRKR